MKIDEMFLVGGSNIECGNGIIVRQPKLDDIRQPHIGFGKYNYFLNILSMSDENLQEYFPEIPEEIVKRLTTYDVVTSLPPFRAAAIESFSFFCEGNIDFAEADKTFKTSCGGIINTSNFNEVRKVILKISCLSDDEIEGERPANKRASEIYKKIIAGRKQMNKSKKANSDLLLPNIISSVCARSPSYNLTNIWQLTVWQLYDQFARVNINSQAEIVSRKWAAWGKDEFDYAIWYKQYK